MSFHSALGTLLRFAPLLHCVDKFDAQAFGLSKQEANMMDPQQRLLLSAAHDAMSSVWEVLSYAELQKETMSIDSFDQPMGSIEWRRL